MNEKSAALVRANDAKVAIPDANNIRALAQELLASGLFPGVKSVAGAVTIIQAGFELGIPPVSALNTMVIINGRLAMEAKLLLAVAANRVGVTWKIVKEGPDGCEILFSRPGFEDFKGEFTREDAKKANLLGKTNWALYEKDMFFARAAGRGIKRIAPDAILGMVTKEEAEDFVDMNAEPQPAEAAAEVKMAQLDDLKKQIADLATRVPAPAPEPVPAAEPVPQAGPDLTDPKVDPFSKTPLGQTADEFTGDAPEDGPEDLAPAAKVERVAALVATMVSAGVMEEKVWSAVQKKLKEKYNLVLTDTRDLTNAQADDVIGFLSNWFKKVMAEKKK